MKRIRLQVAVLPWDEPGSQASPGAPPRQETLRPWLQVCTEEMTLQDLADAIIKKFASVYIGRGTLNIKHLESDYGDILDLNDTVGDVFDDRAPSGENRTSIVRVARYPPDPSELRTLARFESLMPESSARPKKRPLGYSPPEILRSNRPPIRTVEDWGSQRRSVSVQGGNKRQKLHESRVARVYESDQEGGQQIRAHHSSHLAGAQVPVQVFDSQNISQHRHSNPDGPPVSFPQEIFPPHPGDTEIPNSPTRQAQTVDLDRESTKSESPEIRPSVHQTPPYSVDSTALAQSNTSKEPLQNGLSEDAQQRSFPKHQPSSSFQFNSPQMLAPSRPEPSQESYRPESNESVTSLQDNNSKTARRKQPRGEETYDPIESDTESFYERQQMHSSKRLRLGRTPGSPHHTTSAGKRPSSRSGQFKNPVALPSHATEVPEGSQEGPIHKTGDHPIPLNDAFQELIDAVGLGDQILSQPPTESSARETINQHHGKEALASGAAELLPKTPSQVMGPPLPVARMPLLKDASVPMQSTAATDTASTAEDDLTMIEAERLQKEAKEQQEKKAARQKKAENKRLAAEKANRQKLETATREEAEVERLVADSKEKARRERKEKQAEKARSRKEQAEQEAQAKQENEAARLAEEAVEQDRLAKEEADAARLAKERTETDRKAQEMRAAAEEQARQEEESATAEAQRAKAAAEKQQRRDEAARLEGQEAADKLMAEKKAERERNRREEELAREGEKLISAAEGARQLESEKDKTPNPASKTPKAPNSRSSTPGTVKYTPRTEEQKIRRRERDAQKKADEARRRQDEGKRAYERGLFIASKTAKDPANKPSNSAARLSSSAAGPGLSSSPISSKSSAAPPRSILKRSGSNNTLRRSESHNEDPRKSPEWTRPGDSTRVPVTTYGATPSKSLRDINNSLVPKHFVALEPPREFQFSKPSVAQNKPVQSKLNVTVDRKMKGKAIDPPAPVKDAPVEPLVLSSDDEDDHESVSTWYSEDERNGVDPSSKAGPSSKSKTKPGTSDKKLLSQTPAATAAPPSVNIDPALRSDDKRYSEAPTAQSTAASTTDSASVSENKSISRSPARQRFKTASSSSGSNVGSEESDDSCSSSVVEIESPVPKARGESTKQSDKVSGSNGTKAHVVAMDGGRSTASPLSYEVSAQPQHPMSPPSTNSTDIDEAVNAQIQGEIRASLSPTKSRKDSPVLRDLAPNEAVTAPETITQTRMLHVKTTVKPSRYRYPKLSEMMKAAQEDMPPSSSMPISSSLGGHQQQTFDIEDDLSSDSDDSDSDSDEEEGNKPPGDTKRSVMKSLRKLANASTNFITGKT